MTSYMAQIAAKELNNNNKFQSYIQKSKILFEEVVVRLG